MKSFIIPLLLLLVACQGYHKESAHRTASVSAKTDSPFAKAPPVVAFGERWDTADDNDRLIYEERCFQDEMFRQYKDTGTFESINDNIRGAFVIGHPFSTKFRDAVFRFSRPSGEDSVIILRQSAGRWDTLLRVQLDSVNIGMIDDRIDFQDYNGDGLPDLAAVTTQFDMHTSYFYALWLNRGTHFSHVKGFDKIANPEYDKQTHIINSYHSAGCADMAMVFGEYKFTGDSISTIRTVYCDCCGEHPDSCGIVINNGKKFQVHERKAHRYVPSFYAESVREKVKDMERFR